MTVRRMCALAKVSRAGFYRFPSARSGGDAEVELRDAMQRIALEFPSYGWPRMTEELKRRGWAVNHKRVYRLMREDNLLCLRRRKFVVTTDSAHHSAGVSEPGARDDADGPGSALGGRYHLHSAAGRVRLPGGDSGCVFAASDWLGAGPHAGRHADVAGLAHGAGAAAARAGAGASLRPRRAICFAAITPICCARTESSSACRAKATRTTTRKPSRS